MSKFWDVKTLQKFASIHASTHNYFNLERHLNCRETFKENRAAAMAEWRHCHVNWRRQQRTASMPFQAAALAQSHTLKASVRNRLNVDRSSK